MPNISVVSVSIVVCTYNGESLVADQLESILKQTYPIKEILVFDDQSSDNTISVINTIAAHNPIVKLFVNEKNLGYIKNFEQGARVASGDVIAFSDQDDIWLPQKIENLIDAWDPDVPLIYCHSFKTEGLEIPEQIPSMNRLVRRFSGNDGRKIFVHNTVSGHAMLFRKSLLSLVLPFKEDFFYDWWMAQVAAYNGGVQYLPEILVYQRKHNSNATVFGNEKYSNNQLHARFKNAIAKSGLAASSVPNISLKDRKLAEKLSTYMFKSLTKSFYIPLFLLLVKHRKQFFSYKVRTIAIFSHIKHSYRLTKNTV